MASILTTARLVCKDAQARQKAIEYFQKIIDHTTPNEPEVLQYVCALPYDDQAEKEIYMIEEYANQAASDAHMTTKPVQDLIQLFSTGEVLAQPPEVHPCPIVNKMMLGSTLSISSTPVIALLNVPSKPNQSVAPKRDWEGIFEKAVIDVKGLGAMLVSEDKEAKCMRMEGVLQDDDAYREFQRMVAGNKTGTVEMVRIKLVCGFVSREAKSKL
ncbi:hypothetical protein COCCADRAFT_97048 [Bipolaris zeicola 26-R-13]|uniref:ABM domain-containing protein n=1 Tax=Cochliobolus carbonum (strain 26-R-13) TaxID=930089 RepID=W6Y509_COCC2|nr:uncharacterized protein COCCADRAFT_97048 [Bipolaris zeicola 26-R-13]EUC33078.1 hypothetical protein COCCADRAFT_97048 [Bipolaris zeicola 26-R-13]